MKVTKYPTLSNNKKENEKNESKTEKNKQKMLCFIHHRYYNDCNSLFIIHYYCYY